MAVFISAREITILLSRRERDELTYKDTLNDIGTYLKLHGDPYKVGGGGSEVGGGGIPPSSRLPDILPVHTPGDLLGGATPSNPPPHTRAPKKVSLNTGQRKEES